MDSRRMVYPYTLTAKLINFPWAFHYKYGIVKQALLSVPIVLYLGWKIEKALDDDEYVANLRKGYMMDIEKHKKHLW